MVICMITLFPPELFLSTRHQPQRFSSPSHRPRALRKGLPVAPHVVTFTRLLFSYNSAPESHSKSKSNSNSSSNFRSNPNLFPSAILSEAWHPRSASRPPNHLPLGEPSCMPTCKDPPHPCLRLFNLDVTSAPRHRTQLEGPSSAGPLAKASIKSCGRASGNFRNILGHPRVTVVDHYDDKEQRVCVPPQLEVKWFENPGNLAARRHSNHSDRCPPPRPVSTSIPRYSTSLTKMSEGNEHQQACFPSQPCQDHRHAQHARPAFWRLLGTVRRRRLTKSCSWRDALNFGHPFYCEHSSCGASPEVILTPGMKSGASQKSISHTHTHTYIYSNRQSNTWRKPHNQTTDGLVLLCELGPSFPAWTQTPRPSPAASTASFEAWAMGGGAVARETPPFSRIWPRIPCVGRAVPLLAHIS